MPHVLVRTELPVAGPDVVAVLAVRPARWLRTFLVLAVAGAGCPVRSDPNRLWYRVGTVQEEAAGASVSLTWWPHAGPHFFRRFQGSFLVTASGRRTTLELSGDTEDGHPPCAEAAVQGLVDLLGAALAAADQRGPS